MSRRHTQKNSFKRKKQKLIPAKPVFIFCNGEQTEKNYFEALKSDLRLEHANIKVIPSNHNRESLIKEIVSILKNKGYQKKDFTTIDVFAVFDVDALPKGNNNASALELQANKAQLLCKTHKFKAIISNECFELWFLLHYDYHDSHLHRDKICEKLNTKLGFSYDKSTSMYEILRDKQEVAMCNAQKLCEKYHCTQPISDCKPYTNVHELIADLRKFPKEESS